MDLYLLFRLGVIALFVVVFAEASLSKLVARETPGWFVDQFKSTWLGRGPLPLMWWTIAIAELVVAGLFIAALARGEYAGGDVQMMSLGCLGASALFTGLCFGQRVALDFAGAANSFYYSAFSLGLFVAVQATAGL